MKKPTTGVIRSPDNPLDGVRAVLEGRTTHGHAKLRLLESKGAYWEGDKVTVGTGEFIADKS